MSLKRRNSIALILILLAAVCWTFGQRILDTHTTGDVLVPTQPNTVGTTYPTTPTIHPTEYSGNTVTPTDPSSGASAPQGSNQVEYSHSNRLLLIINSFYDHLIG